MRKNWYVLLMAALWLLCALIPAAVAEDAIDTIVEDFELPLDETSAATDELELPSVDDVPEIDPDLDIVLGGASDDGQAVDDNLLELSLDGGITLPDEATEGQEAAQANEGETEEFVIDAQGVLTAYNGAGGAVTIPSTVKSIGRKAFYQCENLTSLTIPGNVEVVGEYAFEGCKRLDSVTLEAGVEVLNDGAFYNCDSLKTLTMADGLKTIKSGAFIGTRIEELIFPDSVTELAAGATYRNYGNGSLSGSLKKVHWPAGVVDIHDCQFEGFSALTEIQIPANLETIGNYSFKNCTSLKAIVIPATVKRIGREAFYNCDALTAIVIPGDGLASNDDGSSEESATASAKFIGERAFTGCDRLSSVTLSSSVKTLSAETFKDCASLKTLTMASGLKTVKGGAFAGSSIKTLSFPDSVAELDSSAISGDSLKKSLQSVRWPAGVSEVHKEQFSSFSVLKVVEIPKGVTTIGDNAFLNCAKLSSVTISSSVKKIADSSFENCPKLEIRTPAGSTADTYAKSSDIPVVHTDEKGREIVPKSVKLNKTKATLVVGSKLTLKATVKPSNATARFTWTSSNKKVATVTKKGVVKALKKGTATITVTTANGKKATCKITVPAAPTGVTLNKTKVTLKVGKKLTLKPKLKGAGAKTTYTWKSSNKKVVTVTNKGVVKALKKGTATITVTTANGKKATCRITVQ